MLMIIPQSPDLSPVQKTMLVPIHSRDWMYFKLQRKGEGRKEEKGKREKRKKSET